MWGLAQGHTAKGRGQIWWQLVRQSPVECSVQVAVAASAGSRKDVDALSSPWGRMPRTDVVRDSTPGRLLAARV